MAGLSYTIDTAASFTLAILMSAGPREEFQKPGVQEHAKDGTPKWSCTIGVSSPPVGAFPAQSDMITVTVTQPNDPALDITPGMPVTLIDLRVGVSAPEKRDNGRIAGGKSFFQASGIRPAITPAAAPNGSKSTWSGKDKPAENAA